MERDRWLTILAVLGTTALFGCEKKDSPATEVPAAAASKDGEQSCGEGGCGGAKDDDDADAEAVTDAGGAPSDGGAAPSDPAAPAATSETAAAPSEAVAEASAPAKPKAKAKPKKKKGKGKAEAACGEGTCA